MNLDESYGCCGPPSVYHYFLLKKMKISKKCAGFKKLKCKKTNASCAKMVFPKMDGESVGEILPSNECQPFAGLIGTFLF